MSELWAIVQRHVDRWGVTSATLSRRMGSKPQTLNSWKNRGLKKLPEKRLLEALARETGTSYGDVLAAVLQDIDYLPGGSPAKAIEATAETVTELKRAADPKRPPEPRRQG